MFICRRQLCDGVVLLYFGRFSCGFRVSPLPHWFRFLNLCSNVAVGSSLSIPEEHWEQGWRGVRCPRDLLCAGRTRGWGTQGALAVWDRGAFLVLGPALVSLSKWPNWKTHFTVAGGGPVAVVLVLLSWGLFVLEAPLIDFC